MIRKVQDLLLIDVTKVAGFFLLEELLQSKTHRFQRGSIIRARIIDPPQYQSRCTRNNNIWDDYFISMFYYSKMTYQKFL